MNVIILAAEGVHHENSFLLPGDINEVIWGSISFLCIVALFFWKGLGPLKGMWYGRIERIANELEAAEASRLASEGQLAAVESDIANADSERDRILVEARETADAPRPDLRLCVCLHEIRPEQHDATDYYPRHDSDQHPRAVSRRPFALRVLRFTTR